MYRPVVKGCSVDWKSTFRFQPYTIFRLGNNYYSEYTSTTSLCSTLLRDGTVICSNIIMIVNIHYQLFQAIKWWNSSVYKYYDSECTLTALLCSTLLSDRSLVCTNIMIVRKHRQICVIFMYYGFFLGRGLERILIAWSVGKFSH